MSAIGERNPGGAATTPDLVREALSQAKELVRLEVALAKDDLRREVVAAKTSAIVFGGAAVAGLMGVTLLLVALALAIFPGPAPALAIGSILVIGAAASAYFGYKQIPRKPMDRTVRRLEADARMLKERVA